MSTSIKIMEYKSPVGELILGAYDGKICLADWKYRRMRKSIDNRICKALDANYETVTTPLLEKCKTQLEEYFDQKRKQFDLPLLMIGTDFQKEVWENLIQIPYGKTKSYIQLANQMNNAKAVRAVATANGANALSIIVPCHRIIGSNGDLVGYAGGLTAKKKLLVLEIPEKQLSLF